MHLPAMVRLVIEKMRQRALEKWAAAHSPLFAQALGWVAHAPIRNRGTVVGSLVHADPASELPALLLCLDGAIVARRKSGERVIPADPPAASVVARR